jgi:hypothetical protein
MRLGNGAVMKRFLIFGLLGPPLGFVMAFWVLLQILNWALGTESTFDIRQIVLIPMSYAIGIVPALLAALFDGALARRNIRWRVLWTTLFAYVLGFLPILSALTLGYLHGPYLLIFGFIGAIPGAICSWLSGAPRHGSSNNVN